MNIVDTPGLDPAYRLYDVDGVHVRVHVRLKDERLNAFELTAQVTDQTGVPIGPLLEPHNLTRALDQVDMPEFSTSRSNNVARGTLCRDAGRIYEFSGDAWLDRGQLPEGASDAAAEAIVTWDKEARTLAMRAARAWKRQSNHSEIMTLLGAS